MSIYQLVNSNIIKANAALTAAQNQVTVPAETKNENRITKIFNNLHFL